MKRYLIIVFILILASAGGYLYFTTQKPNFAKDSTAYKAIPVSAPFFFEISSVNAVSLENPLIGALLEAGIGDPWFNFLQEADSVVSDNANLPRNLLSSPFILTWGFSGRDQMIPLLIKKAGSASQEKALEGFLNALYPPSNFKYNKREYGNFIITEVLRNRPSESLFFSFAGDLLLVSTHSIVIEQVILQMSTPGIADNPYFQEVNKAAGSQGVGLYINHSRFDGFLRNILTRKSVEKTDEFGAAVRFQPLAQAYKFNDYAGWSEVDFTVTAENLQLSGISSADDSLNHFLTVFNEQQPVKNKAEYVLPANTSFFCSYSFSDKDAFFNSLEDFFTHSPDYYFREERMKRFDMGMRVNLRSTFAELIKDEVIVAAGTIPVNAANKNVYFIVRTANNASAEAQIKRLIANYASRTGTDVSAYSSGFTVDNEVNFPVYRFPYTSFPGLWLGNPFTMAEANYVSFYDDIMVFSNSEAGIHEYLRNMVLGTTMAKNPVYAGFSKSNSKRSNVNVFVDVNRMFSYRNELFSENLLKQINEKEEQIRKFGMVSWQVGHLKSGYSNSFVVSWNPVKGEEAQTTWQSVIGSNLQQKPHLLDNHTDPLSRDIVFQDKNNMLHQVTASGRVRWSIPISGPVISDIHQIDFYHNGRLQYLFNTKDKIYLIDRNGNNVADFPVSLPSPATNGLNVFDYDNNRNYRFFLAGEDKKIYAYDREGKIIKGWNFDETEHEVTSPVQHFRVDGKDFIVFKDKSQIYIQNRQGESRTSVSARFENSGNKLVLIDGETPILVATDKNGKVYYIDFKGNVIEKKTPRFSENHFFTVDDIDGNGVLDFVFADGNELTVLNEKGKKMFSRKFNNRLMLKPNIYTFSDNLKKIGVTDEASNRIYLINPDGKLHQGFPLQGNSEFSIGKLSGEASGLNLIVGSEGGMLYNYTLY